MCFWNWCIFIIFEKIKFKKAQICIICTCMSFYSCISTWKPTACQSTCMCMCVCAWWLLNVCPEQTDAKVWMFVCVNVCPVGVRFRRLASILAGLLYHRDGSSVCNDNCVNWAVRGSCPLTSALRLFSLAGVGWLKKEKEREKVRVRACLQQAGRTQLLVQGLHYPKAAYWFTLWDVSSMCLYWCCAECICMAVSCDR